VRVAAVLVAAGKGKRFGGCKQFYKIFGLPLIFFPLNTLCKSTLVHTIIVVVHKQGVQECKELVREQNLHKVEHIVIGGERRQDSVRKGLDVVGGADYVLVHDGARPLLDESLIESVLDAASKVGAASCGLPIMDTVKCVKDGMIKKTVEREGLWLTHTPQAFRKDLILYAHKRANEESFFATDDAALLEHYNIPVKMVRSNPSNIKVTFPEDAEIVRRLLEDAGGNRI
jgi:2-C-methyl-D-erythritol 4-phosphate cytidylyltransferase